MAETSSAFCAAKNWDAPQTNSTPSSSTLSDLLTEFKTSSPSTKSQLNKPIKNGNGVNNQKKLLLNKEQLAKNNELKKSSTLINLLPINSSLSSQLNSDLLSNQSISGSPIEQNKINHSLNRPPSIRPDNEQLNNKADNQNKSKNESKLVEPKIRQDNIKFEVGFKIEACDSTGIWYKAKIVALDEQENKVFIHFINWSKKFDVWMPMDSSQLRALTVDDNGNTDNDQEKHFTVGKSVLASWSDNKKYPGIIQTITNDGNYNILFLDGYRKKVKKSLVEHIPADYEINFNSPIVNLTTTSTSLDGQTMKSTSKSNNLEVNNTPQTNGSTITSSTIAPQLLNATSIQRNQSNKKRSTDHLVATKEFVITEDHNQFKCGAENCNKSFRKEKLLNSHIKYYHPNIYNSEEYKKRRLEDSSNYLDDSLSNDQSINSSKRTTINENSNTSWNSEIAVTPKNKSINKKNKELIDKSKNRSSFNNDLNDQQQFINGEQEAGSEFVGIQQFKPSTQKKRNKSNSKQSLTATDDLSKNSSPNLSNITTTPIAATNNTSSSIITPLTSKLNRFSNQNDSSINYASDSTIEDSISSFDSPSLINNEITPSKSKINKRGRAPGKRKIKERIDPDYFEDSNTLSATATPNSTKSSTSKRKYRSKAQQNCLNKELLELKMDLQEKQQQRLNDGDHSNLFFTNTPSTSSASESALAECGDYGDFHYSYNEKKYRDTSPFSLDDFAQSPTNSLYISDSNDKKKKKSSPSKKSSSSFNLLSSTNKRPRLVGQDHRNLNSPSFLTTSIIPGYQTPSRKSFVFRDGFIFSANNEVNSSSSNVSPLSLHALEKPIPNTILPFWDARYVRAIHESDEVDELVHCICDFKEESGLMIQCECCLTWSHGTCFDIETEDKVPESYVCFTCKDPKAIRESQRYIYDQEWLKKGKNPCFQFIDQNQEEAKEIVQSQDSIKRMVTTNQILSILTDTSQILRSLRYKMNLVKENNIKEMKNWEAHLEDPPLEDLPLEAQQSVNNNDDLLNNEDELVKDKILDQNITQTEHEMIGDILNFSKNLLLDNVQTDDKGIADDDINNDLDDATDLDLIDFITSTGKEEENDQKNHDRLNSIITNSSKSSSDLNNFILDTHQSNSITKSTNSNIQNDLQLNNIASIDDELIDKKNQPKTLEEKLLEHINSVQMNCMKNLELAEKKINELENESEITDGLKEDLIQFKDIIKDVYQDLQNVNRFTMI